MMRFVSKNTLSMETEGLKVFDDGLSVLIFAYLGQKSHFSACFVGSHGLIGPLSAKRAVEFASGYRLSHFG